MHLPINLNLQRLSRLTARPDLIAFAHSIPLPGRLTGQEYGSPHLDPGNQLVPTNHREARDPRRIFYRLRCEDNGPRLSACDRVKIGSQQPDDPGWRPQKRPVVDEFGPTLAASWLS